MRPAVVLVEPQTPGNIGATARVMKNFGVSRLFLVNPDCSPSDEEAVERAVHAKDVLRKARVTEDWPKLDYLAATTARVGGDHNVKSNPLTPREAAPRLASAETGIVFGPEDNGLSNDQVKRCDYTITIPAQEEYPTLNLSHAVTVILYEVSREFDDGVGTDTEYMGKEEKDVLLDVIHDVLDELEFQTEHDRVMDDQLWQRIIGRSLLSKKEAQALMGVFRKIDDRIDEV